MAGEPKAGDYDRCQICEKVPKSPALELMLVPLGDDEFVLCSPCRADAIEGMRLLLNGMRRIRAKAPLVFQDRLYSL